jgi:hypothetical protein
MQSGNIELLFPSKAIELLSTIRGEEWEKLVNRLDDLEPNDPDRIAFVLMMVRISGCTSCQADSFRAMRGCLLCSSTTMKRYKGSDHALVELFKEAKKDVLNYLKEDKYNG